MLRHYYTDADVLAEGIFMRPEAARSGFANDDDGRMRLCFLFRKAAATRQAQAECLKISGGDEIVICLLGVAVKLLLSSNSDQSCLRTRKRWPLHPTDAFHTR